MDSGRKHDLVVAVEEGIYDDADLVSEFDVTLRAIEIARWIVRKNEGSY